MAAAIVMHVQTGLAVTRLYKAGKHANYTTYFMGFAVILCQL